MIRDFKTDDTKAVMQIWLDENRKAHDFISQDYWVRMDKQVRQQLPQATMYVFQKGNRIQGFIGLMEQYIAGIFVNSQDQSKGIGTQLLRHAKQTNTNLSLHVYQKNIRALHFYQREGFLIQEEEINPNTGELELRMVWEAGLKQEITSNH